MQLIVLENEPSTDRGGQERSLFDVCQQLSSRGHEITFLYTRTGNLLPHYEKFCQQIIQVNGYQINKKKLFPSAATLYQDIQKIKVDRHAIVYANQYHDSFFGAAFSRLRGNPFVCHLRLPPPSKLMGQQRLGMQQTHRMIAVSQQTKSAWMNVGFTSDQIAVVPNGIPLDRFHALVDRTPLKQQWNLPLDAAMISYIGRIHRVKGLETLLQAFAQMNPAEQNLRLLIAGKPSDQEERYLQEIKQLTNRLNITDQVTFLGHVSQPEQVYQISDLVIAPSHWNEPFARVIIEAMACETPTIASQVGGIPEILSGEFEQFLFPARNAQALAERMRSFINWRQQMPQLGQQCRQHAINNFALEKTVDGIEKVLLEVLESKKKIHFNGMDWKDCAAD